MYLNVSTGIQFFEGCVWFDIFMDTYKRVLDIKRSAAFIDHEADDPKPTNDPGVSKSGKTFSKWLKYDDEPIFFGVDDTDKTDSECAFCDACFKWIKLSTTTGNIIKHIKTHKHVDATQGKRKNLVIQADVEKHLVDFVVTQGLSYRLIENEHLTHICDSLPSRKQISEDVESYATDIKAEIKQSISKCTKVSIMIDEWTSRRNDKYLGVTMQCLINEKIELFTLAHTYLDAESCTATFIAGKLDSILQEYGIRDKVEFLVTDAANVMQATAKILKFNWFPCVCHQINLMTSKLVEALSTCLKPVYDLQNVINSSQSFTAYARKKNSLRTSLPTFTPTRWYSITDLLEATVKMEQLILDYNQDRKENSEDSQSKNLSQSKKFRDDIIFLDHHHSDAVETAKALLPFFIQLKDCIKNLESDEYGTIGLFIPSLYLLRMEMNKLDRNTYEFAIRIFEDSMDMYYKKYFAGKDMHFLIAARLNPTIIASYFMNQESLTRVNACINNMLPKTTTQGTPSMLTLSSMRNRPNAIPVTKSELDLYDTLILNNVLSCTMFWTSYKRTLPNLYNIAQRYLYVPVSSASCERLFSKSNNFLTFKRLSMSPAKVENQAIVIGNPKIYSKLRK